MFQVVQDLHDKDDYRKLKRSIVKKLHWEPKKPRRKWHILEVINQSAISLLAVGLPSITPPTVSPQGDLLLNSTEHDQMLTEADDLVNDHKSYDAGVQARTTILGLNRDKSSLSELPRSLCGLDSTRGVKPISTLLENAVKVRSSLIDSCLYDSTTDIEDSGLGESYELSRPSSRNMTTLDETTKNLAPLSPSTAEKSVTFSDVLLPATNQDAGRYSPLVVRHSQVHQSKLITKTSPDTDQEPSPSNVLLNERILKSPHMDNNKLSIPSFLPSPPGSPKQHLKPNSSPSSGRRSPRHLDPPMMYLDRNSPRSSRIVYGISPRSSVADCDIHLESEPVDNSTSTNSTGINLDAFTEHIEDIPVFMNGIEGHDLQTTACNGYQGEKLMHITCL